LHNEELHNFFLSPDIIRQTKSREWGGQGVWHARESRDKYTEFFWESPKERNHSKNQGVNCGMGSEWILGRLGGGVD
jgi:hypothetical protein